MSTRKDAKLHGILAACTTPFTEDGSAIDEAALVHYVNRLIDAGIHGLVPTGTTGEFMSLTPEEYRRVISLYIETAAGRVPVVPGIGQLTTDDAIELAQYAEQAGADAIMVVPPFYDPLSFEYLQVFLGELSAAINLQIIYYNVPGCTGIRLDADQLAELGSIPGVDYLKDTSGDAVTLAEMLAVRGGEIKAFNGWDSLTFFGIASGAEASVWGLASILPDKAVELWHVLAEQKDLVRARELWVPLWELSSFLESVNYVAGVKTALEIIGESTGPTRRPILALGEDERAKLTAILQRLDAV